MTFIITAMSVVLVIAVIALVFVAYQARREQLPGGEWVGGVIDRANDAVPIIRDGDLDPVEDPPAHIRAR